MIYIKEAHPNDGWVSPANVRQGISIKDPKQFDERAELAHQTCTLLKIKLPTLVDGMDDAVNKAYSAWPDRLYIVGADGNIALMGDQGPKGFKPSVEAAREWLEKLGKPAAPAKE